MPSQPPLIPRRVLFGHPTRGAPSVSPDGTRISFRAPLDGVMNLWVAGRSMEDARPITRDTVGGIRRHTWARDGRHVLFLQDTGGDENTHLKCIDVESGAIRDLTPHPGVQASIVLMSPRRPDEVLISLNLDDKRAHDVYRVHLGSAECVLAARNDGQMLDFVADLDLSVRAALRSRAGAMDLLVRDDEGSPWRSLLTWEHEDAFYSTPLAFRGDGRGLYLLDSRGSDTIRLVLCDVGDGRTTVLAQEPGGDATDILLHPATHEAGLVAFEKERVDWKLLDASLAADVALVRGLDPGDFSIGSQSDDGLTWIVAFNRDDGPVSFWIVDRRTRQATHLFHHAPELLDHVLAPMRPISIPSRDGLTLRGYLTAPTSLPMELLPMVLIVHGGPAARDSWGFDPEAQLFANRGYLVLQINFRGSVGYGKAFRNAGDREWGGKMHDDLVDAVAWAVREGYADPARVAIYGGSYGGYAALVGATFTPDLFCCAIDIVGPSNLITFVQTLPPYWSAALEDFHQRLGHPERDADFLRSRSPLFKADRIRIPLLIAQGANDPRVKAAESEQIVAALRERGIPHEYMLFPDEGHGFEKQANRLAFYEAAERFLARHLGGRCEG